MDNANLLQAMLYAAGVPDKEAMAKSPHVGIASVWWEGNPCNMHLLDLGKTVKKSVMEKGMIGWQYNTIGVSDAITMGSEGDIARDLKFDEETPLIPL
jgi:dihydroxy-acid dehydratase